MQVAARPMQDDYITVTGDSRYDRIDVWRKGIDRIVTEGISPEQAVDEAIARIKLSLSEKRQESPGPGPSGRPDQHFRRDAEPFVQASDHVDRQAAAPIQHLRHPRARPDQPL
jgi:hypothetical protein